MSSDFTLDSHWTRLVQYKDIVTIPNYVLSADRKSVVDTVQLSKQAYAMPDNQLYPCHTKAATWLSYFYFLTDPDTPNLSRDQRLNTVQRLYKYATVWGIEDDFDKLERELQEPPPQEPDYMMVVEAADGRQIKRYPITSSEDFYAQAAAFVKERYKYPFSWRHETAKRFLKMANDNGIKLTLWRPYLEKMALQGTIDKIHLLKQLMNRVLALSHMGEVKLAAHVAKLGQRIGKDGVPSDLYKLAESIDYLDRITRLYKAYGKLILPPEEAIFKDPVKQPKTIKTAAGEIEIEKIASKDLTKLEKAFGQKLVDKYGLRLDTIQRLTPAHALILKQFCEAGEQ